MDGDPYLAARTAAGVALLVASHGVWLAIMTSGAWMAFAASFTSFV